MVLHSLAWLFETMMAAEIIQTLTLAITWDKGCELHESNDASPASDLNVNPKPTLIRSRLVT